MLYYCCTHLYEKESLRNLMLTGGFWLVSQNQTFACYEHLYIYFKKIFTNGQFVIIVCYYYCQLAHRDGTKKQLIIFLQNKNLTEKNCHEKKIICYRWIRRIFSEIGNYSRGSNKNDLPHSIIKKSTALLS